MRLSLQSACAPFGTLLSQVQVPETVTVTLPPLTTGGPSRTIDVGFGEFANAVALRAANAVTQTEAKSSVLTRIPLRPPALREPWSAADPAFPTDPARSDIPVPSLDKPLGYSRRPPSASATKAPR